MENDDNGDDDDDKDNDNDGDAGDDSDGLVNDGCFGWLVDDVWICRLKRSDVCVIRVFSI